MLSLEVSGSNTGKFFSAFFYAIVTILLEYLNTNDSHPLYFCLCSIVNPVSWQTCCVASPWRLKKITCFSERVMACVKILFSSSCWYTHGVTCMCLDIHAKMTTTQLTRMHMQHNKNCDWIRKNRKSFPHTTNLPTYTSYDVTSDCNWFLT